MFLTDPIADSALPIVLQRIDAIQEIASEYGHSARQGALTLGDAVRLDADGETVTVGASDATPTKVRYFFEHLEEARAYADELAAGRSSDDRGNIVLYARDRFPDPSGRNEHWLIISYIVDRVEAHGVELHTW
jgi:hypothetical protein